MDASAAIRLQEIMKLVHKISRRVRSRDGRKYALATKQQVEMYVRANLRNRPTDAEYALMWKEAVKECFSYLMQLIGSAQMGLKQVAADYLTGSYVNGSHFSENVVSETLAEVFDNTMSPYYMGTGPTIQPNPIAPAMPVLHDPYNDMQGNNNVHHSMQNPLVLRQQLAPAAANFQPVVQEIKNAQLQQPIQPIAPTPVGNLTPGFSVDPSAIANINMNLPPVASTAAPIGAQSGPSPVPPPAVMKQPIAPTPAGNLTPGFSVDPSAIANININPPPVASTAAPTGAQPGPSPVPPPAVMKQPINFDPNFSPNQQGEAFFSNNNDNITPVNVIPVQGVPPAPQHPPPPAANGKIPVSYNPEECAGSVPSISNPPPEESIANFLNGIIAQNYYAWDDVGIATYCPQFPFRCEYAWEINKNHALLDAWVQTNQGQQCEQVWATNAAAALQAIFCPQWFPANIGDASTQFTDIAKISIEKPDIVLIGQVATSAIEKVEAGIKYIRPERVYPSHVFKVVWPPGS